MGQDKAVKSRWLNSARIAFRVASILCTILIVAAWVHSYWHTDIASRSSRWPDETKAFWYNRKTAITSNRGGVSFAYEFVRASIADLKLGKDFDKYFAKFDWTPNVVYWMQSGPNSRYPFFGNPQDWPAKIGFQFSEQMTTAGPPASRSERRWQKIAVIPCWFLACVTGIPIWRFVAIKIWLATKRETGVCLNCGYDLRSSPDRCPECGTPVPSQPAPV